MATTIDHSKDPIDEGIAINTELDAQTLLLQTLANNTKELNSIKELIKQTNKILQKIYE